MCGRFTRDFSWRQVHDFLDLRLPAELCVPELLPSWNVAPSQETPVCRVNAGRSRELVPMRWGFKPAWARDGTAPINVRAETMGSSPMFREAVTSRRCLVPVSGFYEWRADGKAKVPHYIRLLNDRLFCLAGLWEGAAEQGEKPTFAILTTRSNELMKTIHDRMPVIVRREDYAAWLSDDAATERLIQPFPAEEMNGCRVGSRVGNPRNDDAELIRPIEREGLFE